MQVYCWNEEHFTLAGGGKVEMIQRGSGFVIWHCPECHIEIQIVVETSEN